MELLLTDLQQEIRQELVPVAASLPLLALVPHQEAALELQQAVVAGKAPVQAWAVLAVHRIVADHTEVEAKVVEEVLTSSGVQQDEESEDRKDKEDVEAAGRRPELHRAGQAVA